MTSEHKKKSPPIFYVHILQYRKIFHSLPVNPMRNFIALQFTQFFRQLEVHDHVQMIKIQNKIKQMMFKKSLYFFIKLKN
ncbi:hypothetical protein BpHYR1_042765 [Brachionus plicatilis]|uniref:Uncharacterized protein n=1 Tax=Brachionus plicatilis TaxID=10195 RepID=A0A3M7SCS3_BRAPC|nr:hypothetical protein BpHYR1_042765 [Brachionus plicatilis]